MRQIVNTACIFAISMSVALADQILVSHTDDNTTVPIPVFLGEQIPGTHQSTHAVAADLDGDFYPEIISASIESGLQIIKNDNGTSFTVIGDYDFSEYDTNNDRGPVRVSIEDLDQDTNKDIIVNFSTNFDEFIIVFFGDGEGDFSDIQQLVVYEGAYVVKAFDFDKNGLMDIFSARNNFVRINHSCPREFSESINAGRSQSNMFALNIFEHSDPDTLLLLTSTRGRGQKYLLNYDDNVTTRIFSGNHFGNGSTLHPYDLNNNQIIDMVSRSNYMLFSSEDVYSAIPMPNIFYAYEEDVIPPLITEAYDIDLDGTHEIPRSNFYIDFDGNDVPFRVNYNFGSDTYESGSEIHNSAVDIDLDGDPDIIDVLKLSGVITSGRIAIKENLLLSGTQAPRSRAVPHRPAFAGGDISGSLVTFQHDVDTTTSLFVRTIEEPWHAAGTVTGSDWSYTPEFGSGKYFFQAVSKKENTYIGEEEPHGRFGFPESFAFYNDAITNSYTHDVCCDDLDYEFPLADFVSVTLRPYDLQTTGTVTANLTVEPKPVAKGTNSAPIITISETDVDYSSATLALEFSPSDYPDPAALQTLMFDDDSTSAPIAQTGTVDPENPWRVFVTVTDPSGSWYLDSVPARVEEFEILDN